MFHGTGWNRLDRLIAPFLPVIHRRWHLSPDLSTAFYSASQSHIGNRAGKGKEHVVAW